LVVLEKQGFEESAQGGLPRALRAVDPDDQRTALISLRNILAQRTPVFVNDRTVVGGQTLGDDQAFDRGAHATLSGSGSPFAKASIFARAFIPIAMRVSASALPRCGSRTTFSSSSSASGTRGSCG